MPGSAQSRRRFAGAAAAAAMSISATAGAEPFPTSIDLPDGFQPEGIAIGAGPTAWFGSLADGDIYRADLRTGTGELLSEGPGTPSVGLAADRRGRLFVAGGPAGTARVIDSRSGEELAGYQFSTETSFINDVVITADKTAWFTNSFAPELYGVPLSPDGSLPDAEEVETLPLGGAWEQGEGFGANGLVRTPDDSALLVVHSTSGLLYRVSPSSGEATVVDLGDTLLTGGDGMLLHDTRLYVVQNRLNQIAVIDLDDSGTSGELVDLITDDGFDVPTTIARFGSRLYLPNARFGTEPTADTAYWVTSLPRS